MDQTVGSCKDMPKYGQYGWTWLRENIQKSQTIGRNT